MKIETPDEATAERVVGHDPCWWHDNWRAAFTHGDNAAFRRFEGMGCRE
jgi:hypothetical protein